MLRYLIAAALMAGMATPARAQQVEIIPRTTWKAASPKLTLNENASHIVSSFRQWRTWKGKPTPMEASEEVCIEKSMDKRADVAKWLTVHHSAEGVKNPNVPGRVDGKVNEKLMEEMRAHQDNMLHYFQFAHPHRKFIFWGDTPYHYRIDNTGEVIEGRELKYSARSNTIYKHRIDEHVTVVLEGNFEEGLPPTQQQVDKLVLLLAQLAKEHNVPLNRITYHKEAAKEGRTPCPGKHLIALWPAIKKRVAALGIKDSNEPEPTPTNIDQKLCQPFSKAYPGGLPRI